MRALLILLALLVAAPALAQEQAGCDKFKWPLERERALLGQAAALPSGSESAVTSAAKVALVPAAEAKLPVAPSRESKPGTYAGFVRYAALPGAGTYRVTLTDNAWIEVVQAGQLLKVEEFSGVHGCAGLRKSVKFKLSAAPFVVMLSGMATPEIGVVVTPD
jgi:hypothetical protein